MLFRNKYERSMKRLKDQSTETDEVREKRKKEGVPAEKHDFFAMTFSAMLVFIPVALGVLLLLSLSVYLLLYLFH